MLKLSELVGTLACSLLTAISSGYDSGIYVIAAAAAVITGIASVAPGQHWTTSRSNPMALY